MRRYTAVATLYEDRHLVGFRLRQLATGKLVDVEYNELLSHLIGGPLMVDNLTYRDMGDVINHPYNREIVGVGFHINDLEEVYLDY